MKKYKVGDTFFVALSGRYSKKEGLAVVKKVGRKYAEIGFIEKDECTNYRLNMENGFVFDFRDCEVGVAYKSKDEYDVATRIENAAEKIYREMSCYGIRSKLLSKSIEDLRKIAEIMEIELD